MCTTTRSAPSTTTTTTLTPFHTTTTTLTPHPATTTPTTFTPPHLYAQKGEVRGARGKDLQRWPQLKVDEHQLPYVHLHLEGAWAAAA